MPIYAYRCANCGHAQDVLQKISDPLLTTCPVCGAEAFSKQVTAAGFQLKGSGWYVTDFRGGNKPPAEAKSESKGDSKVEAKADSKAESKSDSGSKPEAGGKSAAPSPAAAASPSPAPAASAPPPPAKT